MTDEIHETRIVTFCRPGTSDKLYSPECSVCGGLAPERKKEAAEFIAAIHVVLNSPLDELKGFEESVYVGEPV